MNGEGGREQAIHGPDHCASKYKRDEALALHSLVRRHLLRREHDDEVDDGGYEDYPEYTIVGATR